MGKGSAFVHTSRQPANHANKQKCYAKRCVLLTSFEAKGRFIIIKKYKLLHTFFPVYPLNYCTPRKMWQFKIFFYTSSILLLIISSLLWICIIRPLETLCMHVHFSLRRKLLFNSAIFLSKQALINELFCSWFDLRFKTFPLTSFAHSNKSLLI